MPTDTITANGPWYETMGCAQCNVVVGDCDCTECHFCQTARKVRALVERSKPLIEVEERVASELGIKADLFDWDGCGQLLEAMRAKGWFAEIRTRPDKFGQAYRSLASVKFHEFGGYPSESASANDVPTAAVLAAAKALGVSAEVT